MKDSILGTRKTSAFTSTRTQGGIAMTFVRQRISAHTWIITLILVSLLALGCSVLKTGDKDTVAPPSEQKSEKKEDKNKPLYYEFADVLIPAELKPDTKNTFVYQTAGLSAGVMTFNGRVELSSLVKFFERNMRKDNWRKISTFKSPRTMLLFQKENRLCVIQILEGYKTEVIIWVAPTLAELEAGN